MHEPDDRDLHWRLGILRGYLWVAVAAHLPAAVVPVVLEAPVMEIIGHLGLVGVSVLLHGGLLLLGYLRPQAHRVLGFVLSVIQVVSLSAIALNAAAEARPGVMVAFAVVPVLATFSSGRTAGILAWVLTLVTLAALALAMPGRAGLSVLSGTALGATLLTAVTIVAEYERERWARRALAAQQRLSGALAEAERAGKAKETFLATMSHEIRTPLNGVLGLTEALLDTRLDAEQQRLTTTVLSSGRLLKSILDDVLDLARMNAEELHLEAQPVRLRVVVDDVLALHGARAKARGLWLTAEVDDALPEWVLADDMRLAQVLGNLVSNALKFTESGGVRVRAFPVDAGLRVEVIDTGIGIAPEQAARLFDPFVQADDTVHRTYGGTGLGLAICARIIDGMGGRIAAEPREDGACFWFEAPLPEAEAPTSTPDDAGDLGGLVVLLVEDNPVNQMVARRVLEKLGATVHVADDGQQAIEHVRRGRPDVVLMDGQMPVLDGYETTRRIRRMDDQARLPIVALTAAVTPDDRARALDAGMDALVAKPIDRDAVLQAVEAALVARGHRRAAPSLPPTELVHADRTSGAA